MRKESRIVAFAGMLLLMPLAAHAQHTAELPDEVKQFYQTRNMVAAISTPTERTALAANAQDLPLADRLARVYDMLQTIAAQELPVDPGMIRHVSGELPFVPSAILEVVGVRETREGVLEVETVVRHLSQEDVFQLIRSYESGKKIEAPHLFGFSPVTSREIHTWHNTGGRWLRLPAGMALLAE
jgi:hypothetical protein